MCRQTLLQQDDNITGCLVPQKFHDHPKYHNPDDGVLFIRDDRGRKHPTIEELLEEKGFQMNGAQKVVFKGVDKVTLNIQVGGPVTLIFTRVFIGRAVAGLRA